MRKKCIYRALVCTVLSGSFLIGQTPPAPPTPAQMVSHQVSRLTTLLSLNSAQQTQATTIFTGEQTATATLMASMRTAHSALVAAVEANDTATITAQATEIGNLTGEQVTDRSMAQAAFYAILTADQQAKYKQLLPGGPGGPGNPGAPGGPGGPPPLPPGPGL